MFKIVLLVLLGLFVTIKNTQAYLDPGTGSYITQLIIGFSIGGIYLIKIYWSKIKSRIKSIFKSKQKHDKKNED